MQLHERRMTQEKLEEAIEKGVLVVCEFHEAYLRYQLDYADYSSNLMDGPRATLSNPANA